MASIYVFLVVIHVNNLVPVPAPLLFCCDMGSRMGLPITRALVGSVAANISNNIHRIWYRRLRYCGPHEVRQVGLSRGFQDHVIGLLSF
jgi:hypothetical protein